MTFQRQVNDLGRLLGQEELRLRMEALKSVFPAVADAWAKDAAERARRYAPRGRTGRLAASIKARKATGKRVRIVGMWYGHIVDVGAKEHDIGTSRTFTRRKGKFKGQTFTTSHVLAFPHGGQTIFAKKVHKRAQPGSGYMRRAAREAAQSGSMANAVTKAWDDAA